MGREGEFVTHSSRVTAKGHATASMYKWCQSWETSGDIWHRKQKYNRKIKVTVHLFPPFLKLQTPVPRKRGLWKNKKQKREGKIQTKKPAPRQTPRANQATSLPPTPASVSFPKPAALGWRRQNQFGYMKAGTNTEALKMVKIMVKRG